MFVGRVLFEEPKIPFKKMAVSHRRLPAMARKRDEARISGAVMSSISRGLQTSGSAGGRARSCTRRQGEFVHARLLLFAACYL